MEKIKLPHGEWEYDLNRRIGAEGGFGKVFLGKSKSGEYVAVKQLKIEALNAAHRELRVADELMNNKMYYVVPILDSGKDINTGRYFIIMPVAEKSLQDLLDEVCCLSTSECVKVILQIANGLEEVGKIIHRDLKPQNILYHDGSWKIADFGIAKFIEESTSLRTLKGCLSPLYAAPEQWKFESPTHATDIYSLGCIGITLLNGLPPFISNTKEGHLYGAVPPIRSDNSKLKTLLTMMLRKLPEVRPNVKRVKEILSGIIDSERHKDSTVFSSLAKVGAITSEKASRDESNYEEEKLKKEKRNLLGVTAIELLKNNFMNLLGKITDASPAAETLGLSVSLGFAQLSLSIRSNSQSLAEDEFENSKWDVITSAVISVIQSTPLYNVSWTPQFINYYEISSTLWYARLTEDKNYRWIEVSYITNPLSTIQRKFEPFALNNPYEADIAASNTMGLFEIDFGPEYIDDENENTFHNRWAELFLKASTGQFPL